MISSVTCSPTTWFNNTNYLYSNLPTCHAMIRNQLNINSYYEYLYLLQNFCLTFPQFDSIMSGSGAAGRETSGNANMAPREITLEELSKHNTETDAWIGLNGKVYDVTSYIRQHPGGKDAIMYGVGRDATEMFNQVHEYINPDLSLPGKQIGVLRNN